MKNTVDYTLALETAGQISEDKRRLGQWTEFIITVTLIL